MSTYVAQHVPVEAGVYDPPKDAYYYQVFLDPAFKKLSIMKRVIGSEGKAIKAITHQARVSYMWYFELEHAIGIWVCTRDENVAIQNSSDAKQRVLDRVKYIVDNYGAQAKDEDEKAAYDAYIDYIEKNEDNIYTTMKQAMVSAC